MKTNKIAPIILGITMVGILAACSDHEKTSVIEDDISMKQEVHQKNTKRKTADVIATAEDAESSIVQIPNPFTEADDLEEAAAVTGFTLNIPNAPEDHPDRIIRVMDKSMIEVIYANNENETENGIDEAYRIRKARGNENISGDYNQYESTASVKIGRSAVTIKGNGETCSLATWTRNGFSYAISVDEKYPLTKDELASIAASVE